MKSIYRNWQESGELKNILDRVRMWRGDGAELNEIAKKLGISRTTLFEYQDKYPDFADALKTGEQVMNSKVEDSLIKECVGYEYEETTTTTTAIIDKKTGQVSSLEKVEKRTTKRYARPSVTAIAYFLNNRVPSKWKNRVVTTIEEVESVDDTILEIKDFFSKKKSGDSKE